MAEKTVSVPVRHYQTLTEAARCVLGELDDRAERGESLGIVAQALRAELVRWYLWHQTAEEMHLTDY